MTSHDLLLWLAREHRQLAATIDDLVARARTLDADGRRSELRRLTVSLTTHVVVEDLVVHRLADRVLAHGDAVVRDRHEEFDDLQRRLVEAGGRLDDPHRLAASLVMTRQSFGAHEDGEELEVFPYARHAATAQELARLTSWHRREGARVTSRYLRERRPSDPEPWDDPRREATLRAWLSASLEVAGGLGPAGRRRGRTVPAPEPSVVLRRRADR